MIVVFSLPPPLSLLSLPIFCPAVLAMRLRTLGGILQERHAWHLLWEVRTVADLCRLVAVVVGHVHARDDGRRGRCFRLHSGACPLQSWLEFVRGLVQSGGFEPFVAPGQTAALNARAVEALLEDREGVSRREPLPDKLARRPRCNPPLNDDRLQRSGVGSPNTHTPMQEGNDHVGDCGGPVPTTSGNERCCVSWRIPPCEPRPCLCYEWRSPWFVKAAEISP
jgi:hypothetical protein